MNSLGFALFCPIRILIAQWCYFVSPSSDFSTFCILLICPISKQSKIVRLLFVICFRLYGCYENIYGGRVRWALQDITGGITNTHYVSESSRHLLTIIDLAMTSASLVGAYISVSYQNTYY